MKVSFINFLTLQKKLIEVKESVSSLYRVETSKKMYCAVYLGIPISSLVRL